MGVKHVATPVPGAGFGWVHALALRELLSCARLGRRLSRSPLRGLRPLYGAVPAKKNGERIFPVSGAAEGWGLVSPPRPPCGPSGNPVHPSRFASGIACDPPPELLSSPGAGTPTPIDGGTAPSVLEATSQYPLDFYINLCITYTSAQSIGFAIRCIMIPVAVYRFTHRDHLHSSPVSHFSPPTGVIATHRQGLP